MGSTQKTLLGMTGVLLLGFIAFEVYTYLRVIQVIPYSSTDVTTWARISQQRALARPFFVVTLVISVAALEYFRRDLPRGLRIWYVVALGLAVALLVLPWIVDLGWW